MRVDFVGCKRNGVTRICLSIVLGLREDSEDVAVAAAISWLFRISRATSNDFDLKSSRGLWRLCVVWT